MKRRRFLQMGAAAVAGAVLEPASLAFAAGASLRAVAMAGDSGPLILLHSATASVAEPVKGHSGAGLGVLGWLDGDLLHLMIEKPHPSSRPEFAFPGLQPGQRYRMRLMNATNLDVPVRLPAHQLVVTHVEQAPVERFSTQAVRLKRFSVIEAALVV